MVKVEIHIPVQIYGFLEAAAKFSGWDDAEQYIREYVVENLCEDVECDVDQVSGSHLWGKKSIRQQYGLNEVKV